MKPIELTAQGVDVALALQELPANERARFASAIKARANEWNQCGDDEYPRVWPMVLQLARDPKI